TLFRSGFVSSVTAPFCGDCHRARVSADGRLYTCLFSAAGLDLRPALAQGELALADHMAGLWSAPADRYSETRGSPHAPRRHVEKFLIGGLGPGDPGPTHGYHSDMSHALTHLDAT